MPRSEARIKVRMWTEDDQWLALPMRAQWLYLQLVSSPDVNLIGVLPLLPEVWADAAADADLDDVERALGELEDARFVVVDRHTREVLLRTFLLHDGALRSVKTRQPAARLLAATRSRLLAATVLGQYQPDHLDEALSGGWIDRRTLRRVVTADLPDAAAVALAAAVDQARDVVAMTHLADVVAPPDTPPDTPSHDDGMPHSGVGSPQAQTPSPSPSPSPTTRAGANGAAADLRARALAHAAQRRGEDAA